MPRPNLADPSVEPTDEDLLGLAERAFADVPAKQEAARAKLDREIAQLTEQSLIRLEALRR